MFTRNATSNWGGLYFTNSGGGTLNFCTIEWATYGIYCPANGSIAISHSTVRNNTRGIEIHNGAMQLSSMTFSDNDYFGLKSSGVAVTFLDANIVVENSDTGVSLYDVDNLSLTGLTVRGCSLAGLIFDLCDNAVLDNLTLTGNTGTSWRGLHGELRRIHARRRQHHQRQLLAGEHHRGVVSQRDQRDPDLRQHQQRHPGHR